MTPTNFGSTDNVDRIKDVVARIPKGKVATYGQIARLAGLPKNARQVGAVLRNLPDDSQLPWHRVVNSRGQISERGDRTFSDLQRQMLESEGIDLSEVNKINLAVHQMQRD